ncbi:MAG: DUF3572 domain-containing protein [Marinomonas sp.]
MSAIGSSDRRDQVGAEASVLSLAALGWLLEDDDRAQRFMSLTGLDPDTLRAAVGTKAIQAAVLEFLANHEPDLLRAAEALATAPEELIAAMEELKQ